MQNGWSNIKKSGDFLKKIESIGNIPENNILVTADVVGLCPNISHNAGLKSLNNMLEAKENKIGSTEDPVKMACIEFNGTVKKQTSGTAIGTKFASPYACIFKDEHETKFLQSKPLLTQMTFTLLGLVAKRNLESS